MAEETGSTHIQPSHQADLLVTSAELVKRDPVWLVLVKAQTEKHQGNAHGVPNVSVHYYCESHLAPRPGCYIRVYIEGQKAGIEFDPDVKLHRPAGEIVLDDVEVVGQRAILAEQDK